jgi:hypothetical protein
MRTKSFVLILSLVVASGLRVPGAPLAEARVTKVVNDVKVVEPAKGGRKASLNDVIRDDLALTTGIKSRSELVFQDDTLTRLGPESYFSFKKGTRDINLERGTLLLQVPKGQGGANIHTGAVTASITGTTILVEHKPKRDIKVLVLEGHLRLSVNGTFGDSVLLQPGNMVIMRPDARRVPDPVTVDLSRVLKTSTLIKMKGAKGSGLPSQDKIEKEASIQQSQKGSRLAETNLVIDGAGTKVLLENASIAQVTQVVQQRAQIANTISNGTPPEPGQPPSMATDVGPAPTIKVHGKPNHDLRTEVKYGSDGKPVSVPIVLNTNQDWSTQGGTGKIKMVSNDSITINGSLKVSDTTSLHDHGEITIESRKTSGSAIVINSSAQLLALLNAVGQHGNKITFKSAGGDIDVSGTVQADGGPVEMRNDGANGNITLANATLHGDVIKIGALGNNGTLTVGGGTLSADTTIKLFAGGSNGTVNFVNDVTLSGNSAKIISGNTVTIFNGKTVTINGPTPVNVYTNNANYTGFGGNGSTTGTFAGQGAVTHPLSGGPGY